MKKIGIIGSGGVAKSLGTGLIKHGYSVMLGTRDKSKLQDWLTSAPGAQVGSFEETANFGELIILAVKGTVAVNALRLINPNTIKDKTVIDATNPIADAQPVNGVLKFFTTLDRSLMEELQELAPEAHFVKAFNSVGSHLFVDPPYATKPTMFICGNNDNAKKEVTEIIDKVGWEAADFGKVEAARAIEPLCMLWCIPGMLSNQWGHAFKLLK